MELATKAARKSAPSTARVVKKRKRHVDMCENCGGEYDSDDDGCCKYRLRIPSKTRRHSVETSDSCSGEADSEGDSLGNS